MDTLIKTLSSQSMWGAILASIVIISLGYILVKVKVFKVEWKKALNAVVLKVALPVLAVKGFMSEIDVDRLIKEGFVLGFSFGFYLLLLFLSKFVFIWVKENKTGVKLSESEKDIQSSKTLMRMMLVFGSTTFFGFPIVEAVYGSNGMIDANIFNIGYRVFLYSYCFSQMAGIVMNKENIKASVVKVAKNPIIIGTFIGLTFWIIQLIPGTRVTVGGKETSFFVTSKTAPWLYTTFAKIAGLCSPLVWLSIGMTLAESKLRESATDKRAWIYVALKQLALPALTLGLMLAFSRISALNITPATVGIITVLMATPPATVVIAYAMEYKRNEKLAASSSTLSTFAAVIAMPFWIVVASLITSVMTF